MEQPDPIPEASHPIAPDETPPPPPPDGFTGIFYGADAGQPNPALDVFSTNLDDETRQYWEERFGKFKQQTAQLASDVHAMHTTADEAVAQKARLIAEEAASIDAARRVRERFEGVDLPVDLAFAEIAALRKLRREEQARRLAKEALNMGRNGEIGAWRELELRGKDPKFRHVGPDGGEMALEMRLHKLADMRKERAEFQECQLRTIALECRVQDEVDGQRERKETQRWLKHLDPIHWNQRSHEPAHARELHKSNYRQANNVKQMEAARKLHAGVGLTKHYDAVSSEMSNHGAFVQSYMENEVAFDRSVKEHMLTVTPLDPSVPAPY